MSEFVEATKPIVLPLIKGEERRLSIRDQKQLSTWIALAVIVSEFERQEFVTIPADHRQGLMQHKSAPPNWKIWIGDYDRKNWEPHWIHHRYSVADSEEPIQMPLVEGPLNSQTTIYAVGRLFVYALSSAVSGGLLDWEFTGPDSRSLRQILPVSEYSVVWPTPPMNDRTADRIADSVMSFSLRLLGLPSRAS